MPREGGSSRAEVWGRDGHEVAQTGKETSSDRSRTMRGAAGRDRGTPSMLLGARLQANITSGMVWLALLHPALLDLCPGRTKHLGPSVGQTEIYRDRSAPQSSVE